MGDFVVDSSICSVNPTGSMAPPMGEENQMGVCNEEKWIEHYSSSHKILLVGEGDFSFAVCLAKAFGTAENMIATSSDSKGISWAETFFHLLFLYICFCPPNLVHYFGHVSNWDLFDMYANCQRGIDECVYECHDQFGRTEAAEMHCFTSCGCPYYVPTPSPSFEIV